MSNEKIKITIAGIEFTIEQTDNGEARIVVENLWQVTFNEVDALIEPVNGIGYLVYNQIGALGMEAEYVQRDLETGECIGDHLPNSDSALATCVRCGHPIN